MKKSLLLFALSAFVAGDAIAYKNPGQSPGKGPNTAPALAAGCTPPKGSTDLTFNNVKARIHTGGDMWWDLTTAAQYEVPKGSGKHALFAGSLWLGGQDVNGQLKLAALRFRQVGIDFWTGPLTLSSADVDPATCAKYDKHFGITVAEVAQFDSWWRAMNTPDPEDDLEFAGYTIPESILEWPAHGDESLGQSFYLAPFYDRDGDGRYDPENSGDYPFYDLHGEIECTTERIERLYGDTTLWWVFNDKGNVHTETGGAPIGMEIHAQAFAFATNDEINNMTFYNYRLINRSTFTLTNTYFGVWTDADLGHHLDDYVGCDVVRGLGYSYNGTEVDGTGGPTHYGAQPPAVGVDFFEGPYQDNDGIDNAVGIGPNEALNGIGYGDGVVDNERFGMRRFLYFNNTGQGAHWATEDPSTAADYYNFLRSIWKDQTEMYFGGTGHLSDANANQNITADFMFPGESDPSNWGTGGVDPGFTWTERSSNNQVGDRRFVQSAGPFTLTPGAVNDITVGIVWARATGGGPEASVADLFAADDKAQSLFENCFRVLSGPDAPQVSVRELDREIILMLSNPSPSNNQGEEYADIDPFIPELDISITTNYVEDPNNPGTFLQVTTTDTTFLDRFYRFQGYQIYQVVDETVTPSEVYDPDRARLVAQADIKDSVTRLINFNFNPDLGAAVPQEMVNGANQGIRHSFRITEDQFATGDQRLVNHKTYYFLALAYAFNEFAPYDPTDPTRLTGQQRPFLTGRLAYNKGPIRVVSAVPHITLPQNGGTVINSVYGEGPFITRVEGTGNGGNILDFLPETEEQIMSGPPWKADFPVYRKGRGPVNVMVVDPLSVPAADFQLVFQQSNPIDSAGWVLNNFTSGETISSERSISVRNEQLIPDWGLSVLIEQVSNPGDTLDETNGYLEATLEFSESGKQWLTGVPDLDGVPGFDWVRAGTADTDANNADPFEVYERMGVPFFAPYAVANIGNGYPGASNVSTVLARMDSLKSVDIVMTSDESKWTRCPVIEINPDPNLTGGVPKNGMKRQPSLGKDGLPDNSGTTGMSWFPGYAICLETGERLNMAFSEDTWLAGENGNDMRWNPTASTATTLGTPVLGGRHYIYVFNHTGNGPLEQPAYDEGEWMRQQLNGGTVPLDVWKTAMWVGLPLLQPDRALLATDVKVRLRVARAYKRYNTEEDENDSWPNYRFSTHDMAATTGNALALETALDIINVVPNPYYAFSEYEENQLDNRIKIVNLPEECQISIYTMAGTLVRQFNKADPSTSLDWDLENHAGIPIASGVYLIHVNVPGVGERVLKWFGIKRPVDLQSF